MAEYISEVARIRQQIEDEAYAMYLAFNGFASVAKHVIIAHSHHSLEEHRQELTELVGPEKATEMTMTVYLDMLEKSRTQQEGGASKK